MTRQRGIPGVTKHAVERMAERVGRPLSAEEWRGLVAAIVERRALVLAVDGPSVTYAVPLGPLTINLVWHEADAVVLTVLPQTGHISPQTEGINVRPNRSSFAMAGHWYGNRRRKPRTVWQ